MSVFWHYFENIFVCRYTLPHRRKVSRLGENEFWSAREQVTLYIFWTINDLDNAFIYRVISMKILKPCCDVINLLKLGKNLLLSRFLKSFIILYRGAKQYYISVFMSIIACLPQLLNNYKLIKSEINARDMSKSFSYSIPQWKNFSL